MGSGCKKMQDKRQAVRKGAEIPAFCMAAALLVTTACGGEDLSGSAGTPGNAGAPFDIALIGSESTAALRVALNGSGAGADSDTSFPEGSSAAEGSGGGHGGEEDFERIMAEAELPQPYAEYMEILEQIRTEGRDSNGREYHSDRSGNFENNCFAILDVDGDGRQELLFRFNESYLGAMCEVVYEYDAETDTLREELAEWVDTEYYNVGTDALVKVQMSHDHGKDPESRGVWPYMVYRYDAEQDSYRLLYTVDGWDGRINGEGFPDELDADGDKLLYCVTVQEGSGDTRASADISLNESGKVSSEEDTLLLDREAYESWAEELLPQWSRINVAYHSMTEASMDRVRSAYRQAAVYAAQADVWFMEDEIRPTLGNYLLYDLDNDGSLELTVSIMQGTGRYSYNHFYGLTDRGKVTELELVRLVGSEERDWNADFDLGRTRIRAYQDRDGIIHYEGNDYVREGIYGGYDETGFYYLKDGVVYQDSIRGRTEIFGNGEDRQEDEIHYYGFAAVSERTRPEEVPDARAEYPSRYEESGSAETKPAYEEGGGEDIADEEITEEQYEAIWEEYVKDMTEIRVYQNWVYFTWDEITKGDITEEIICLRLFDSCKGSE